MKYLFRLLLIGIVIYTFHRVYSETFPLNEQSSSNTKTLGQSISYGKDNDKNVEVTFIYKDGMKFAVFTTNNDIHVVNLTKDKAIINNLK